jgi:hypothetical protein
VTLLDRFRTPAYNCADYVAEVWLAETGQDIRPFIGGFFDGERVTAPTRHSLQRLDSPASPCLVLFRRGKDMPHIGVFLRGRVQHLAHLAPIRQPLHVARLGYRSVRFYAPR